jgi:hypothetical protein
MMDFRIIKIKEYDVLISECDFERVIAHRWHKCSTKRGPYFEHKTPLPDCKSVFLHRFIVSCPVGMQVDHINGDTLDNRRSNLRICTITENNRNCHKYKNNTSGYKGVHWDKEKRKWRAAIKVNKKIISLGRFDDPEKAYEAYVAASKKYHGEFGRTS